MCDDHGALPAIGERVLGADEAEECEKCLDRWYVQHGAPRPHSAMRAPGERVCTDQMRDGKNPSWCVYYRGAHGNHWYRSVLFSSETSYAAAAGLLGTSERYVWHSDGRCVHKSARGRDTWGRAPMPAWATPPRE